MAKDELLKEDGNNNLPFHGHQTVSLSDENEFSGFKAEEALQLSNLERRLVEMVWQDDSSGLIALLKHASYHVFESPCSKDEGLYPSVAARLLQLACKLDSVKCAQVLIEGQTGMVVNINEMDCFGRSPLHTAAEMLSAKCIDLLLRMHARTDVRSNDEDALLALEISLASQRMHVSWSPEKSSVEELLLSLKDMDLTAIRLLAESTKDLKEVSYMMAVEGRVVELASILLVAADKVKGVVSIQGKNSLTAKKNQTTYEQHSEDMFQRFLELKSDNAESPNKSDPKEVDTKIGICRYFHSPNGCGRGIKCHYSHGEEAPRSKFLELKPKLLRYNKDPTSFEDDLRRKIFVGGLPLSVDSDDLKKFFEEEFGPVEDALVIPTKVGSRVLSKGFGFLTFKQEDTTKMAVKAHFVTLYGKMIEIKSAIPKSYMENSSYLYDHELAREDLDEANYSMSSCVDSIDQQVPPWLVRFKKWFPAYLNKTCKRLGEGETYPLSSLKGDFRATCGMELDHESIGFLKLSDFLRSLPGICKMHVVSTANGSPTHMVLKPFYTLPCNLSQQSKHASFVAHSSSISDISDVTSFSDESITHENIYAEIDGSMQRSTGLITKPGRLGDEFHEYNMWTSAGLFDQPSLLEKIAANDTSQQPFSFFAHQWDSGLIARGCCVYCKTSLDTFTDMPYLHKVCHSCKKDFSSSFISGGYYGGTLLQKPTGYYEEFPSVFESAYPTTVVYHHPPSPAHFSST